MQRTVQEHVESTKIAGEADQAGFKKLKQLNPAWAIVGQGYIAKSKKTDHDKMKFNYNQSTTKSQASTLGLGVSGYGIDLGYSHGGTDVSTATSGQGFPKEL